ncbi:hypothetical protein AB0K60_07425 [Thermopolyspora sp. NPDC052614]|uniref:hypothetical protein n=1 Tax=Thermopolyspora sp. NPDC052614 TaxID=3155682 RepID=UPI00343D0285
MQQGRRSRAFIPVLSVLAVGAAGAGIAFATLTVGAPEKTGSVQFSNPNSGGAAAATTSTVKCPTVADKLPDIPASAQAEVDRSLRLLDTQIAEANQRIVNTVGQGGPNLVQNAILGPLEDKRVATINRIATAIGRSAARPIGLEVLAPCTLNQ